jgi:hypothetical protein
MTIGCRRPLVEYVFRLAPALLKALLEYLPVAPELEDTLFQLGKIHPRGYFSV